MFCVFLLFSFSSFPFLKIFTAKSCREFPVSYAELPVLMILFLPVIFAELPVFPVSPFCAEPIVKLLDHALKYPVSKPKRKTENKY